MRICFVILGTKFRLLRASAHPALQVSEDQTTLHYSHISPGRTLSIDRQWAPVCFWRAPTSRFGVSTSLSFFSRCPSILGELLPPQGCYYWEADVSGSTAYRLGLTYSTADRKSPVGENNLSWCLQCVPAPSGYVWGIKAAELCQNFAAISVKGKIKKMNLWTIMTF